MKLINFKFESFSFSGKYQAWCLNNIKHRLGKCGFILFDQNNNCFRKKWIEHGKLHRLNAPAIEIVNGNNEWYKNGKRHNLMGPANIFNGNLMYFVEDWPTTEKLLGLYKKLVIMGFDPHPRILIGKSINYILSC